MIVKRRLQTFFVLMLIVALTLAACSNDSSTSSQSGSSDGSGDGKEKSVELAQGVTDDEILIGHLGPQTGPAAIYDGVRKGIESYFNYVNENGGVNGRKLKLIAYDDEYQPAKTVQLAKRLVEDDKVFAMVGNVGTAPNLAIKDYLVEKGFPMVMVGTGNNALMDPPLPNYMGSDTMNYSIEGRIFLHYAVEKLGAKRIAVSYQNDDYGKENLQTIKDALSNYPGVEIVQEVTFLATDSEFSSQAQKLQEANPDTIIHFSTPPPAANLKKALYKIGFNSANFIVAQVAGGDPTVIELAGKDVWEGTYTGSTIPSVEDSDDPQMKIFVERYSKDYPGEALDGNAQTGWGAAEVLVEALKRTGDELTWDNFLKTFYTFDNWDGSIYRSVTIGEGNHYALNSMVITQVQDGKIVPISDLITFDPKTKEFTFEGE